MTSSCGPFHEEALRRQRIIDRKSAALSRIRERQEDEKVRMKRLMDEEKAAEERHTRKMNKLRRQLNSTSNRKPSGGYMLERSRGEDGGFFERVATYPQFTQGMHSVRPTTVMGIPYAAYKEIKGKEKILRDNNLYQGHPRVLWNARA